MLKRIKMLVSHMDEKQEDVKGLVFDSLICRTDNYVEWAAIDTGYGCVSQFFRDSNSEVYQYEVIGDLESIEVTEAIREVEVIKEIEVTKEIPADIERDENAKGYVIVPASSIDQFLAEEFDSENTITAKELISMNCSAILAINNGDHGEKSLNKKLYKCMGDFAEDELNRIVN